MSATLDYDLKKYIAYLTKDCRWAVLTVMILHANIRNRAYPTMQTLADMAAGGNLHKATAAKKWLEKHGAFELVAYGKRVDDEKKCGKRQHIYQLTGVIQACSDPGCDCWHEGQYRYLHFDKQHPQPDIAPVDNINTVNVVPINNITDDDIAPVDTIKTADIVPTDNVNGYKRSITKVSNKDSKSISPNGETIFPKIETYIKAYEDGLTTKPVRNQYGQKGNRTAAADLLKANIHPSWVTLYTRKLSGENYWKGKKPPLSNVADGISAWLGLYGFEASLAPPIAPVGIEPEETELIPLDQQQQGVEMIRQLAKRKGA